MAAIVSVVVHPSRVYREGLTHILAKSPFEPVCTASSTEDVPSTISGGGEQVLVLIGVREVSNLAEALCATKASFPDAHVVVIGDATKCDTVAMALGLGATSFVDENMATSTLVKELELVALGEPVISVFILKQLLRHCSAPACGKNEAAPAAVVDASCPLETRGHCEPRLQLSGRETAILNGLVQGASNKVIAFQLKITEATVKVHVKAILRKIRVKNRTQAAIWALNCQTVPNKRGEDGEASPSRASLDQAISETPLIGSQPREGTSDFLARR